MPVVRLVIVAVSIVLATFVGGLFGYPPNNISVFWPANATLFAALLLVPRNERGACLAISPVIFFGAELLIGFSTLQAAVFSLANCTEVFLALHVLRRLGVERVDLAEPGQLLKLLVAASVGSVFGATIGGLGTSWTGGDFLPIALRWAAADLIGYIVVAPALLTLPSWRQWLKPAPARERGEALLILALTTAIGALVSHAPALGLGDVKGLLFLPIPIILWAAFRLGEKGAAASGLAVAAIAMICSKFGHHGISPLTVAGDIQSLQFYIACISITALTAAGVCRDRDRAIAELNRTRGLLEEDVQAKAIDVEAGEQRFRALIEGSIQGVIVHRDWRLLFANDAAAKMFGYTDAEEFLKVETIANMIAPHEHDRVKRINQGRVKGDDVPSGYEVDCVKKDGSIIVLDTLHSMVEWEGGRAVQSTAIDVTDRHNSEEALRESAARYVEAARIAKLGHWTYDLRNDRLSYCSEENARIHGMTVAEYMNEITTTARDIERVHPEDREKFAAAISDKDGVPQVFDVEYRIIRKDGQIRHLREIGEPIKDPDGGFSHSRGTIQDITEQKERERELRESEARFRAAERIASLFNWQTTSDFSEWLYASDNAAKIYGRPLADFTGPYANYRRILHPEDVKIVDRTYASLNEYPRPYELEYRFFRADGETRWLREVGEPIRSPDDTVLFYRGTSQDVTEIKKIENELMLARLAAENASKAKSDFLANMSHELRTPLNSILGFSDLITTGLHGPLGNPKYEEYLRDINKSGQLLLSLISDILDISKIEAGRMEIDPAPVNLANACRESLDIIRVQADAKHQVLSLDATQPDTVLEADARILRQIIVNLLSNAVKFTPARGTITIAIDAPNANGVVVKVTDSGIGIARDDIERALAPFSQVGAEPTKSQPGTGLGLFLARRWMELHDGSLTLESEPGVGTTVILTFPAKRLIDASGSLL